MERKRKENIKIDNSDSTKEVLTLGDDVNSDEMEELDQLMNNSDTDSITNEEKVVVP